MTRPNILLASMGLALLLLTSSDLMAQTQRTLRGGSAAGWDASNSHLPRPSRSRLTRSTVLQEDLQEGETVVAEPMAIEGAGEIVDGAMVDGEVVDGGVYREGPDGEIILDEEMSEGYYSDAGTSFDSSEWVNQFCICLPSHGWFQADYLLWDQNGMQTPALVTSSPAGTLQANAGVLGLAPTQTLLGNGPLLDDSISGGRFRFGWWLARHPGWGLEGEYLGLGKITDTYRYASTGAFGSQILARPFYNVVAGAEMSQLVAFDNTVGGRLRIDATSQFDGAAVRLRRSLFADEGCTVRWWDNRSVPTASRMDLTLGYRYFELDESLAINEQLDSLLVNEPGSFNITDSFATGNQFNGFEIGTQWQRRKGLWSLDLLMRLGLGNNHQTVAIRGQTIRTEAGVVQPTDNAGIYAQRSNIGTYERDRFAVIPELGATLGYQLTRRLRFNVGYSFIYWSSVVRPGDQIDRDLNPNLFPPEPQIFTGPLRPEFRFTESDYWVQGISFGAEYRW